MLSFDSLVQSAFTAKASDIHIVPESIGSQIFLRVGGQLQGREKLNATETERLLAQVRVACALDVSVKQILQDGRFQLSSGLSGRVSIMPTLHGSACVVRLFQFLQAAHLTDLGFSAAQSQQLTELVRRRYGLLLVVGPTGSGKTTTLYHLLKQAQSTDRVLVSLEDPIEADIAGVRQTSCRPELGLTFGAGLRALLRQDPDVMLVGEIRDSETAEIAVRAALTGHLVLTSVHARDTSEALLRLLDLGVPAFQLASTVLAAVSQAWQVDSNRQRSLDLALLVYPSDLYDLLKRQPSLEELRQYFSRYVLGNQSR